MTALDILNRALRRPGWAVEKAYLWGRSTATIRADDVILAFYPKTGSTWVRIVLFHLLNGGPRDGGFSFDELDRTMPEFANRSFFEPWGYPGVPRLVKTHSRYRWMFRRNRAVVFAREPRDAMISFLHYARASRGIEFSGDLGAILRHPTMGLDAYFDFYRSWLGHVCLVIKYEDLRADPAAQIRRLVDYVGIEVSDEEIIRALDASTLERTRSAQERSSAAFKEQFTGDFRFARKGEVGEGAQQFDPELDALLTRKRQEYGFGLYDR